MQRITLNANEIKLARYVADRGWCREDVLMRDSLVIPGTLACEFERTLDKLEALGLLHCGTYEDVPVPQYEE